MGASRVLSLKGLEDLSWHTKGRCFWTVRAVCRSNCNPGSLGYYRVRDLTDWGYAHATGRATRTRITEVNSENTPWKTRDFRSRRFPHVR